MDYQDWLIAIIPMIISITASFFISMWNDKRLRKKIAAQQATSERIKCLLRYVQDIRDSIHAMQFQLGDDPFETKLKKYFILSGDLQVYVSDNKIAMQMETAKNKKDYYQLSLLNDLMDLIRQVGLSMSNDIEKFAESFKLSEELCDRLINSYNVFLYDVNLC